MQGVCWAFIADSENGRIADSENGRIADSENGQCFFPAILEYSRTRRVFAHAESIRARG